MLHQRQTEARAPVGARKRRAGGVARERLGQIGVGKRALVARDLHQRLFSAAQQPQADACRPVRVAYGIGDKIQYTPLDLLPVDPGVHQLLRQLTGKRRARCRAERLRARDHAVEKVAQLGLLAQQPHLARRRRGKITEVAAQVHELVERAVDAGHLPLHVRLL